jgi:5-methylthioadenosine/S-adenosylhomocysteine deaminase
MGTRWGAEALGLGAEVGSIEKGKAADITVISLTKPHLSPLYDVYSHIVYSARPSDVESVLVNGKLIIEKGSHTGADEEEIMQKARKWGRQIALGR